MAVGFGPPEEKRTNPVGLRDLCSGHLDSVDRRYSEECGVGHGMEVVEAVRSDASHDGMPVTEPERGWGKGREGEATCYFFDTWNALTS